MSAVVSELEDVELENVLQQVFTECNVSLSLGEEVPVFRIVEYVRDQLPTWPFEHLLELWKCLDAVSTNERDVNLRQFKEATKRWIAKVQQRAQDGNNNVREKELHNSTSGTTMDPMKTDMDKDITELELRMRVRKIDDDNIVLREELVRAEELVTNLERQRNSLENQLDRYIEKCQQLEKENDEQKEKLNEMINKEKTSASALQRSTKEHKNLLRQLEIVEIEVQAIPFLKDKMEKVSKEKMDCQKQITKLQEEFFEKEIEYERLKATMIELQDTNNSMKETYEYTIRNLREKNRQLTDENVELQSWSTLPGTSGERLSISPIPETDGCCTHSTPYKSEQVLLQDSLYAELRASGFTKDYSEYDSLTQEFEEKLDQYNAAISTILEELEKVVQSFVTIRQVSNDVPQFNPPNAEDTRTYNIEALKHKVALLLNMATEEAARIKNTRNSSTQLRADATENSDQFGVTSFRDLLTRARQCPRAETDLRSIASWRVNDNEDDPFLNVIRAKVGDQERTINEFVEELDDIIQDTINSPASCKDRSASHRNPRYRSIHTLSSSSPLPHVEDAGRQASNCQSLRTDLPDADADADDDAFARGDSLTWESCDEKSAELEIESPDVPDQEDSLPFEECLSDEMPEVSSALQMDSKALATLEETSDESFQALPKVSGATATAAVQNPRRKISVYYRSFDVVTVRDPRDNDRESSTVEVKRTLSNPSLQNEEKLEDEKTRKRQDQDGAVRYTFSSTYRSTKNDSDSSNSVSPQKQFRDRPDDELPVVQPIKVCLAPTRLKIPQQVESEIAQAKTTNTKGSRAPRDADTVELDVAPSFLLSPASVLDSDKHGRNDSASVYSSPTFITDKCETVDGAVIKPGSADENSSQGHSMSARLITHNQSNLAKLVDPEEPHSWASVRTASGGDQSRIERSVDGQMSSREDTSAGSDSECEPAESNDRCTDDEKATGEIDRAAASSNDSTATKLPNDAIQDDGKIERGNNNAKRGKRQLLFTASKSFSEGENNGSETVCRCRQHNWSQSAPLIQTEARSAAFPSLTDARLQESGIANLSSTEVDVRENLTELELQKKYTVFSLCLSTDRVTLSRRMEVSQRQRDQSEKNLSCEVQKTLQDIQELAPLCTDRESVERVERVRHQLDMVARCAHRVSCAAETLGAMHQEHRISRAVFLADRYLQLLQSKCEKLAVSVAETKRILTEHNIVIEENSGELCDDLPRIRYRSGTPANNRMMMARRRASVATMSRPMGSAQDVTKDTVRQRNSVSGRMTLRRPSFNCESPKWENEKLDRTDSSSSIGELRDTFEHAESQRCSREENNNMLRSSQSNSSQSILLSGADNEIWTNAKQDTTSHELLPVNEDVDRDYRLARLSRLFRLRSSTVVPWRMVLCGILIFCFGFYVNRTISVANACRGPLSRWSIDELFDGYFRTRDNAAPPRPM